MPIITADWKAESSQRWAVPLGAYYNVVKPDDGPDWQLRFQVQCVFPK